MVYLFNHELLNFSSIIFDIFVKYICLAEVALIALYLVWVLCRLAKNKQTKKNSFPDTFDIYLNLDYGSETEPDILAQTQNGPNNTNYLQRQRHFQLI